MGLQDLRGQAKRRTAEELVQHLKTFELDLKFSAGIWFFSPGGGRFHDRYTPDTSIAERLDIAATLADYGLQGMEAHYPNEINEENLDLWKSFAQDTGIKILTVIPNLFYDAHFFQKAIWDRMQPGEGPEKLAKAIEEAGREDHRFHMEGGSWTNNLSWVKGYDSVLQPMDHASSHFYEVAVKPGIATSAANYRNALFHLLASQTSCYRYWGEGLWTEYGREICRRVDAIPDNDF